MPRKPTTPIPISSHTHADTRLNISAGSNDDR
jgi:hypothetical protein